MHRSMVLFVVVAALVAGPAWGEDADTLKRELGDMKRQLDTMRQQYEKAIDALEKRLQQIEQRPAPVAAPPASPPPLAVQQAPAPGTPSLTDLARPRPPFSLGERTGRGQLLFDIGIAGDFIANFTQDNVDKADAGTFPGRENRFFPREIELSLFGRIDPYAQGVVRIEAAEEFEDGARVTELGLAEANFTLIALPFGTQLKLGLMRNRFGLLNEHHAHDLPQPDRPNVLVRFLGEEGLREPGAELSWVAPLPFYLEALAGVFTGDNEVAFGRGNLKSPLVTGRLRTFFDIGDTSGIQFGVSGAGGTSAERRRHTLLGADLKYKFTPADWRHSLLTLGGEALWSRRRAEVLGDPDGDGVEQGEGRTRERFGWYTWAEVQPWLRWAGGVRFDSTQLQGVPGREWAIEPYLTYKPSEFLRFRLAYKYTDRDRREFVTGNGATARHASEIFLQGTFLLGAHPAHAF